MVGRIDDGLLQMEGYQFHAYPLIDFVCLPLDDLTVDLTQEIYLRGFDPYLEMNGQTVCRDLLRAGCGGAVIEWRV